MPFLIVCLFIVAVICLIQGIRKSSFDLVRGPKQQYCTVCGWTPEKVQLCQLKQRHHIMVAPLCFDCCIQYDALPVRGRSIRTVHTTR